MMPELQHMTLLDAAPPPAPQLRRGERSPDIVELMRAIDAYAYDYATEGKLGKSRRTVESMLNEALQVGR